MSKIRRVLRWWPWGLGVILAVASLTWGIAKAPDQPTFVLGWVGLLANCAMAGAALMAFRLWRLQIRGGAEHEIALRALRAAYRVDDAIPDLQSVPKVAEFLERTATLSSELREIAIDVRAVWGLPDSSLFYKLECFVTEWSTHVLMARAGEPISSTSDNVWPFDWAQVVEGEPGHLESFTKLKHQCVADIEHWATTHANFSRRSRLR